MTATDGLDCKKWRKETLHSCRRTRARELLFSYMGLLVCELDLPLRSYTIVRGARSEGSGRLA